MRRSCASALAGVYVALLVAALATSRANAQLGAGPALLGSRLILAMVTDTGNRPLTELEPDDFVIEEGGQPREILSLHVADYPIVILLDDLSGPSNGADAIRAAAARFITRVGERPVGVGTLDAAQLFAPLDLPRADVLDRVRRFSAGGAPPPRPLQAAAMAAHAARDTGAPFSAIVVVSDRAIGSAEIPAGESLAPVLASGVPVYVVALRDPSSATSQEGGDVLRALAEQTRGQYTAIYSSASFSIALDRLADRLATEMLIEYVVPDNGLPAGDVRVGVRIPGAKAIGRGVSK